MNPLRRPPALVAIGASAGGPSAISTVLAGLPRDFPASVVIVQHVDKRFIAGMATWLGTRSALPVRIAAEGEWLQPGTAFLADASNHLVLKVPRRLGYTPEPRDCVYRPSVDAFFESVSRLWPYPAVGVLLTGMGADGVRGMRLMRARGHRTIAQDEATSRVFGMPKAAAAADAAVDVLPLHDVAGELARTFTER
jgi:two-component system, chemotaxis family, response regulator WspF